MPAPAHYRVTYSGIFGGVSAPYEEWSMGLSLAPETSPWLVRGDLVSLAAALQPHWSTAFGSKIGTHAHLTRVRVAYVGDTGHVPRDATGAYIQGDWNGDVTGTASVGLPLQVSLAISLHSAAGGAVGRGRFYLPAPLLGAIANGLIDETVRDGFATNARQFVNLINTSAAAVQPDLHVVVASAGSASRGISPDLYRVDRVSVGRRPDIQRRRGGDLSEQREFLAL